MHNLIKRGDWLGWAAETALHSLFGDEFAQMRTDAQGDFLLLQVLYVSQDYEPGCCTWTIVNMSRGENVAKF